MTPYRCPACHVIRPAEHHRWDCAVLKLTPTQRRALLTFRAVPVLVRRARHTWADPTYTGRLIMGGRSDPRTGWVSDDTVFALQRAGLVSVIADRARLRPCSPITRQKESPDAPDHDHPTVPGRAAARQDCPARA